VVFSELLSPTHLAVFTTDFLYLFDTRNIQKNKMIEVEKLGAVTLIEDRSALVYSSGAVLIKMELLNKEEFFNYKTVRTTVEHGSNVKKIFIDPSGNLIYSMDSASIICWNAVSLEPLQNYQLHDFSNNLSGFSFVTNFTDFYFFSSSHPRLYKYQMTEKRGKWAITPFEPPTLVNENGKQTAIPFTAPHHHSSPISCFSITAGFLITASKSALFVGNLFPNENKEGLFQEKSKNLFIRLGSVLKETPLSVALRDNHFFITTKTRVVELSADHSYWLTPPSKKKKN